MVPVPAKQALVPYANEQQRDDFSKDQFTPSTGTSEDMVPMLPDPALDKPKSKQRNDDFERGLTTPTSGTQENPICVDLDPAAEDSTAQKGDDFSNDETFPSSETPRNLVPMSQDPGVSAPQTPELISLVKEPTSGLEVFDFLQWYADQKTHGRVFRMVLGPVVTPDQNRRGVCLDPRAPEGVRGPGLR